jgi:peptidoglycan/LPS O-acetylase OafA/YrhL
VRRIPQIVEDPTGAGAGSEALPAPPVHSTLSSALRHPVALADYRPDVDGLRAIAILAVVFFHAVPTYMPGGFTGVDVFFVISGFLITGLILRALTQDRFSIFEFYTRRARRIFPALILVLVVVWFFGWLWLLPDGYQRLTRHLTAGATFGLNLILYKDFDGYFQGLSSALTPLWSLGVEEQFYLMWPLLIVAVWRFRKGHPALLGIVALASFALNVAIMSSNPIADFYLPWNRLWELALGGVIAYVQLQGFRVPTVMTNAIATKLPTGLRAPDPRSRSLFGAALLLVSFAALSGNVPFPGWFALGPCLGAALIISAGPQNWFNRHVLASSPMVYLGLISYPLYLWHWPLLSLAQSVDTRRSYSVALTAAAIAAAFVLAAVTYRFVERPVRSAPRRVRVAGLLCVLMIGCASLGYLAYTKRVPALSESPGVERVMQATVENIWPESIRHAPGAAIEEGILPIGNGPRHVLFSGDSNIQQYYSRIVKLLADRPLNSHSATFAVRGYCAFGAVDIAGANESIERNRPGCRTYLDRVLGMANDPKVDTIVIGASWYVYFVAVQDQNHLGQPGPLRAGTDRALDSLKRTVAELIRRGKQVYIVLQMPVGTRLDPHQLIRRAFFPPKSIVDARSPRTSEIMRAIGPINSKLREVAQETGAKVIDPVPSLCTSTMCPVISPAGDPIYRDWNHLRPSYVRDNVTFLDETVLDDRARAAVAEGQRASLQ